MGDFNVNNSVHLTSGIVLGIRRYNSFNSNCIVQKLFGKYYKKLKYTQKSNPVKNIMLIQKRI